MIARLLKDIFIKLMSNYGRKTLLNGLTNAKVFKNKEEGIKVLKELGISENIRAEKLTLEQFAQLSDLLIKDSEN